ncbi:DegV family protein [uncultured Anaerococcus sp.]|uniref:DegV family protein n=1 Tax=uncultured Anaerococcus sp. TaxID=293428 RepID=UPI002601A642|nr:DegV family protein [uncultured Anaerococcus sp.]
MTDYILSCESTMDLSIDYVKELDVSVINANYELNGETYIDDFGQSLDMKSFYDNMRNGSTPTTSRINTGEYVSYLRPLLQEGHDVIHICLSTGMSSQYESLLEAINILKEEFPDRKVYPVDSKMASAGVGLLVSKLSKLKKEGMGIEDLYHWAEENKLHVINYTSNENLEYVARGGRISKTAANIGGMLHICPLIEVDNEGYMIVTTKIRTRKKLLNVILKKIEDNAIGGFDYNEQFFISTADNMELANEAKAMIEEKFPNIDGGVKISSIGPTVGSHIGPGTIAIFYWGKERLAK